MKTQKQRKIRKQAEWRNSEKRMRIGDITAQQHADLFEVGDYTRIAERVKKENVDSTYVSKCIKGGKAPESVAKEIKKYYAEKSLQQAEINAA